MQFTHTFTFDFERLNVRKFCSRNVPERFPKYITFYLAKNL